MTFRRKIFNSNTRHYCLHWGSWCVNSNIVQVCVVELFEKGWYKLFSQRTSHGCHCDYHY